MSASTTTVQLRRETLVMLNRHRDPRTDKSVDDTLKRLLTEGDVFFDIIYVDGDYGRTTNHKIIFQLGDSPIRYYEYSKGEVTSLDHLPNMKMTIVQ